MRKRIEELGGGRFECAEPILQISTDRVEIEVLEGKSYTGEFTITSSNHVPMMGLVYSSNPRMDCLTPKFEGEEVRIRYEFHSEGLVEGDIQKGDFFIICNQGEYDLSFVVSILNLYANSTVGCIRNLSDFTRLAKESQEEARHIFYSPCFKNIMKIRDEKEQLLYEGMAGGTPSILNMEEFLVSTGKKSKVEVIVQKDSFTCYGINETKKVLLTFQKKQWGNVSFGVRSDADFLIPEKERVASEDFMGSICEFGCYIDPDKMHAGKNYGLLLFENIYQQIMVRFCASREEEEEKDQVAHENKKLQVELVQLYQDYRMKKIVTGKWAVKSCDIFDSLIARNPDKAFYRLLKAQAFLANAQRQEAEWILDAFKREWKNKKSPLWGYYLYLSTLMEREESYVNRVTAEIEQLYLEHRESTILFWCLLFLRKEYENNHPRKLRAIEHVIAKGNESPLLYIEAYSLMRQEPFLIKDIGGFELRILNWARKQKALTPEIADQIMRKIPDKSGYQRLILLLLEACYELLSAEQTTGAVCSYLIKNQKYGKRYFWWYERGVELKLRIAGLYEAYLMSMDIRSIIEVPKIILMYFKYNNHLAYRQKAMLYVNIIANKASQPDVYQQYRQSMESFVFEQLAQRHMDDNLAVIYEEVLRDWEFTQEVSEQLAEVLFVHKVTCFEKKAAYVIVLHRQLKHPQIVPVSNGVAYIKLYTNDYCIFIEDTLGNRYSGSIPYQLEKLMYPSRYIQRCLKYSPEIRPYLLYYFDARKGYSVLGEKDIHYFARLMESENISPKYRAYLCVKIFGTLKSIKIDTLMEKYLLEIDVSLLGRAEQAAIMELLAEQGMYDKVYGLVEKYGITKLSKKEQLNLLRYEIEQNNFEEEDTLVGLCEAVFQGGKSNSHTLKYLCQHYHGPTKSMVKIWQSAKNANIDTREIEERIIVQMLYTTEFVDNVSEIFYSYGPEGDPSVVEAYLAYFAYSYFVKETVPPNNLFHQIKKHILEKEETLLVLKLALLKHLSEEKDISEEDTHLLEKILGECVKEGMYFAFYKKLAYGLSVKYHFYDKIFIEYRSEPACRVQLHYKTASDDLDFATEEMTDVYQGIFVKALTAFLGESVQYYITEEWEGHTEITESNCVENNRMPGRDEKNRYNAINEMILARTVEDVGSLSEQMTGYLYVEREAEKNFTIL